MVFKLPAQTILRFCEKAALTSQVSKPFYLHGDRFRLCPLRLLNVSLQPSV